MSLYLPFAPAPAPPPDIKFNTIISFHLCTYAIFLEAFSNGGYYPFLFSAGMLLAVVRLLVLLMWGDCVVLESRENIRNEF